MKKKQYYQKRGICYQICTYINLEIGQNLENYELRHCSFITHLTCQRSKIDKTHATTIYVSPSESQVISKGLTSS